jgi:acylglycerol lipase
MPAQSEGSLKTSDGIKLFRQSWLPDGEARANVMLIHGLGEHSSRYGHVAAALNKSGYAVHTFDLRGHGQSTGKRAYVKSYAEFMDDLMLVRTNIEGRHPDEPFVVLGHSMGGNLALGHVLDHQTGVTGLALSAPALRVGDDLSPLKIKLVNAIARFAPGFRPVGISAESVSRDPAVVAAYAADPLNFHGKIAARLGAELIGAMDRFRSRYSELAMPLALFQGTEDRLVNPQGTRDIENGATNAVVTAHYYEGLFHEVFNEPEQREVFDDLIAWLDGLIS